MKHFPAGRIMGGSSSKLKANDAERIRKKLSLPILMGLKRGANFKTVSDATSVTRLQL